MLLKRIEIKNLGAIDFFECDFEDGLNIIRNRYADEISCAIRLVLGHRASSLPLYLARRNTQVRALVYVEGREHRVTVEWEPYLKNLCLRACDGDGNDTTKEYLYLASHCPEHDVSDVFCGDADQTLFKLLQYLDEDRYYASRELSKRTDNLSETKSFRSYLKAFLKNFQPELIRKGKRYELHVQSNGKYVARCKDDGGKPVFLSESEETLFRYLCFLKTAEFWRGFEELRNLHGIKKPLIVEGFLERLDESIDISELLQRTLQLGRQIILLTA